MWGRKTPLFNEGHIERATIKGFEAGVAHSRKYQASVEAAKKHDERVPSTDENKRLRKQVKKLLERIAYYEKKED